MIADSAFFRQTFTHHGGALDAARRCFPDAPAPWLDLSTGINPRPYPVGSIDPTAWTRLPDAEALSRLEQAAATRYGVPAGLAIMAAPGTQAIIQRLPDLLGGTDVRVLGRTYGEFARVFSGAGARVTNVPTPERLAGADVAVVVNPNNPDGRLLAPGALLLLAGRVGALVVDEAFADALPPGAGVVPHLPSLHLPSSRMIVLRSFGKIYGLAGLRLGFAVLSPTLAEALRRALGPWAVSGPAIALGARALADDAWLAETRARLAADGAKLGYLLRQTGAETLGETPLFRLVSHVAAPRLFEALARTGILVRPFAGEPCWLRFGLPDAAADWERLARALRAFS